jgi:hypothetical protein
MACDELRSLWTDLENWNLRTENDAFMIESFSMKNALGNWINLWLNRAVLPLCEELQFET